MKQLNQNVVLDVSRVAVTFADSIGNPKVIKASGFWLKSGTEHFFVTNKHNVVPALKLGPQTDFRLAELCIELRKFDGERPMNETRFFKVDLDQSDPRIAGSADVCLIPVVFAEAPGEFRNGRVLSTDDLADAEFLRSKAQMMDIASFIGFPQSKTMQWWDQRWNLGVARTVNIASVPGIPFSNASVVTSDTTLVSGLSFAGSSGSVVILHAKGTQELEVEHDYSGYVPPTILGIMSGHWWDTESEPEMFRHSGLSYFTRATSIRELL